MNAWYLLAGLALFRTGTAVGQGKAPACSCPQNPYTDTRPAATFRFSGGQTLVLCGYAEPGSPPTYSEFILYRCGQKKWIDYWDAQHSCQADFRQDTLRLGDVLSLPTGRDFRYEPVVWKTDLFFFDKNGLNRRVRANVRGLKRYTPAQIQQVLAASERLPVAFSEQTLEVADRLLVAAWSGSARARANLLALARKVRIPTGEASEQYAQTLERVAFWEKNKD